MKTGGNHLDDYKFYHKYVMKHVVFVFNKQALSMLLFQNISIFKCVDKLDDILNTILLMFLKEKHSFLYAVKEMYRVEDYGIAVYQDVCSSR
jgi:hypothetical protein